MEKQEDDDNDKYIILYWKECYVYNFLLSF
jgi:hypothetical protein